MSTTDIESAIYADHIHHITGKHTLRPPGRRGGEGKVIPFPARDAGGAHVIGAP